MAKCVINNAGGANGVMIQVLNFFVGKGYTPTQACAIAGNVYGESSFRPTAKNEIGCIGLFQWCSIGKRKEKLIAKYGDPGWKDINNQLNFVWGELSAGGERQSVGDYFKNQNRTLSEYTYYWLRYFETPSTDETKLRNDFMPDRLKAANSAAAVYNQMNKGDCVVDTSVSSGTESSGFSCSIDTTDGTTSDLNIIDTSVSTDTNVGANGNTSTSSSGTNYNTQPLIITDLTGKAILTSGNPSYSALILAFNNNQTPDSVQATLKKRFSNKDYKPKFIAVWFVMGGLKFSDNLNKCREEVNSFITYKISAHTGYTNIYWFPSYNLTMNATAYSPDDKGRRTSQYLLNEAARAQSNPTYHFTYILNLEGQQNLILDDSYGYRTRKNGKYMLTQKAMNSLRVSFYTVSKTFK